MALSFARLKQIDGRCRSIVFGYVRQMQNVYSLSNIPSIISYFCLGFYFQDEYFEKAADYIQISDDKRTITATESTKNFYTGAIGSKCIDPKLHQIATWTFKINKVFDTDDTRKLSRKWRAVSERIIIRIISNIADYGVSGPSYGFCSRGCRYIRRAFRCGWPYPFTKGDIVTVKLDTKERKYMARKNDEKWINVHEGIQVKGVRYKIAVYLPAKDGSVTLIDFKLQSD